jgi:hypothetical protein
MPYVTVIQWDKTKDSSSWAIETTLENSKPSFFHIQKWRHHGRHHMSAYIAFITSELTFRFSSHFVWISYQLRLSDDQICNISSVTHASWTCFAVHIRSVISCFTYTTSYGRTIMDNELGRPWKEVIVNYFKEVWKNITRNAGSGHNIRSLGRKSNMMPPEYGAAMLTTACEKMMGDTHVQ